MKRFFSFIFLTLASAHASAQTTIVVQAPAVEPAKTEIRASDLPDALDRGLPAGVVIIVGNPSEVYRGAINSIVELTAQQYKAESTALTLAATAAAGGRYESERVQTLEKTHDKWVTAATGATCNYADHWNKAAIEAAKSGNAETAAAVVSEQLQDQTILKRLAEPGIVDRIVWWWNS